MDRKYPSKIDGWLAAVLVVVVIVMLGSAVTVLFEKADLWLRILQLLVFLGVGLFTLSLLLNTNYTLTSDTLVVRAGPIRWKVALESIQLVEPSRKAWSSAALSLDRLYIKYSKNQAMYISPEDKDAFMRDLASRQPELVYEIDRVVNQSTQDNLLPQSD